MTTSSDAIRDQITARFENTLYNQFYVDSSVVNGVTKYFLNVGYGYNITSNLNSTPDARTALTAAGILSSDPTIANSHEP